MSDRNGQPGGPGTPPGWYPNPDGSNSVTWWNGYQWTAPPQTTPTQQAVSRPTPAPPQPAEEDKDPLPKLATASIVIGVLTWIFSGSLIFATLLGGTGIALGIAGIVTAKKSGPRTGAIIGVGLCLLPILMSILLFSLSAARS